MADGKAETTTGRRSGSSGDSSVKAAAHDAKETAQEVKDQAADKASDMAAEAKQKSREMAREGKQRARSQAEEQKTRVSSGLRSMADALRRGGEELPEDQRQYGRFLDVVADRAEDASHYLEDRDVESLTREVRTFARDHAPVFLGGAFTLGMLGARFLKSSPRDTGYEGGSYQGDLYGRGSTGGYSRGAVGHIESASYGDETLDRGTTRPGMRTGSRSGGPETFGAPGDYEIDRPTADSYGEDGYE